MFSNFWNKEDSLAEKNMYNEEYIKAREIREKEEKQIEDKKNLKKKKEIVNIKCKNLILKNEKITNFYNITNNYK